MAFEWIRSTILAAEIMYILSLLAVVTSLGTIQDGRDMSFDENEFPLCGNRLMRGHLLALGLRVQQQRIRESQRRVDHDGSMMRRLSTVYRRVYRVSGPKALYHIDGNHKLIR